MVPRCASKCFVIKQSTSWRNVYDGYFFVDWNKIAARNCLLSFENSFCYLIVTQIAGGTSQPNA